MKFALWITSCILYNTVSSLVLSDCGLKKNCSSCIQTPECAWCSYTIFDDNRCFNPSLNNETNYCPTEYVFNPDNILRVLQNKHIEKIREESGVRISPQKLKLDLRLGAPYTLNVTFKPTDQPIDVYYLIDAKSMSIKNRNNIIYFSEELTDVLKNLTNNYKVGFGSFVDKVVAPFVDTKPQKLEAPCEGCASPYGFHHQISLIRDSTRFLSEIRKFQKSGSSTSFNGGMDALMQVLECYSHIGWRENSIKWIIFVSDSPAHLAGDGKEVGINDPNDQLCHLDASEYYTKSSVKDYPSISQINEKVRATNIRVMFAVPEPVLQHYLNISAYINESEVVLLGDDFSKIFKSFDNIVSQAKIIPEFKHTASDAVAVKLIRSQFSKEENLVNYSFELLVLNCPEDKKKQLEAIKFYPVGIPDELIVELQIICSCPCVFPGDRFYEANSKHCSFNGIHKCGICECPQHLYGRHCECIGPRQEPDCLSSKTSTRECFGRGECVCGICECDARGNPSEAIYGKYCQCDNFSCDRRNGILCSGPDYGVCECGICKCRPGWTGDSCSCSTLNTTCIQPQSSQICSGHGLCECGSCICDEFEGIRYRGRYCESLV